MTEVKDDRGLGNVALGFAVCTGSVSLDFASVDAFKAVAWLPEYNLVFLSMNEGLETPFNFSLENMSL